MTGANLVRVILEALMAAYPDWLYHFDLSTPGAAPDGEVLPEGGWVGLAEIAGGNEVRAASEGLLEEKVILRFEVLRPAGQGDGPARADAEAIRKLIREQSRFLPPAGVEDSGSLNYEHGRIEVYGKDPGGRPFFRADAVLVFTNFT